MKRLPHARSAARAGRRLLCLLCALALFASGLPGLALPVRAAGTLPRLSNLILDRVYELQAPGGYPEGADPNDIGFDPDVTQYTGTAYRSVSEVQVYPFAESPSAQVTVNGQALNGQGFVKLSVAEPGEYPVEVKVTDNGVSNVYTVTITKTDADYRGRVPIAEYPEILQALKVTTDKGNEDKLLEVLKKENMVVLPESGKADGSYVTTTESYWSVPGNVLPDGTGTDEPVELFTVDLGDVYSVSRIRAAFGPSNLALGTNRAKISVSTDGVHWETPVTEGNLNTGTQYHQNVTRYELGVSYDARYIRFSVGRWQRPASDLRIYQFMIFVDSGEVPEKLPAPDGASVPWQHEDRHQYLASGQATVVERGLPMLGWTPSGGYGRGTPTVEEAEQFGYDGPLFYDPDFENADYMLYNPDSLWGIAKAPFGGNNMANAGEPREFVPESMLPYIRNAISFCFGDEGGYSTSEAEAFGEWFTWTRQHYPGVILHTNQFPNQWGENQLQEYLRIAQPDLLTWDDYYGDSSWANPSSINLSNANVQKGAARQLLNLPTWDRYRRLAYGGVDGTGAQPILFGQYLDAFAFNHTQSNKNLVLNTSILSGMKWLNFFRVEYQFDRSYLWDEDGTPTRGLLEWGELIDRVHAIDDQLTRLNNDWIMFKIGELGRENNATASGFRRGDFESSESAAKNQEFGLAAVDVESLSTAHSGKTGDVVLGYFNTLPGLYESEIKEYFADSTAPKAFMVMNGLVAGTAEKYNQFNIPAREAGSSANTRQRITITTDPAFVDANYTLYEVDKDNNGALKPVTLDEQGRFTVVLGGGEANLYFWAINTTASATSQKEGAYASFAFDGHPATYWQPQQEADSYTLEKTFAATALNQVTVTEKGAAIQAMTVEYKNAAGEWVALGAAVPEAGIWTCAAADAVQAAGIRLQITAAQGLPAVYEVDTALTAVDPARPASLTVNDNTMGTGLFRFNYDSLWSYRETERNGSSMTQYPLENDGHFSNWNGAKATFTFYGTGVELLLRADQAQYIQAAITSDEGEPQWKAGTNGQGSLVFEGLTQGVHTLTIRKTAASQAGIDGARVTWVGQLPADLTETNSQGPAAVQEYLNQRVTDVSARNHFLYDPAPVTEKNMGSDNSGFNADPDEQNGWVAHVQDAQNQNLGFTRTKKEGASFSVQFYGTGVQLYAGVTPMGDKSDTNVYGQFTFELDGKPVQPETLTTDTLGTNGKVSARMWRVEAPDTQSNQNHLLTVTVTGGYSRVDYAVVERMWESEPAADSLAVSVAASENGSARLLTAAQQKPGGSAVIELLPNEGYQVSKILVNNRSWSIPEDGRLLLTNIQQNTQVQVVFAPAMYEIRLNTGEGGVVTPSSLKAVQGDTVTLRVEEFTGYRLVDGSLKVTGPNGAEQTLTETEPGVLTFVMPAGAVDVTAQFAAEPYPVQIAAGITGGQLTVSVEGTAAYRQEVVVTAQPDAGMRLAAGSLKILLADGGTLLPETMPDGTFKFRMPAQGVTLEAAFEPIPDHTVQAEAVGNGQVEVLQSEVFDGGEAQIRMLPNEGHIVGGIAVNGQPWAVPAEGDTLTVSPVTGDLRIQVTFVGADTVMHTLSAAANEGGAVKPAAQKVQTGGTAVVQAIPDPGFRVERVTLGDQAAVLNEANGTWTVANVAADGEIRAEFARQTWPVTVAAAENGTLTASAGEAGLNDTVTVTAQPAVGYRFRDGSLVVADASGVQQNVTVQQAGVSYTFLMPAGPVSVSGQFEPAAVPGPDPEPSPDAEPSPAPVPSPDPAPTPDVQPTPDPTAAPVSRPTAAPVTQPAPASVPAATPRPTARAAQPTAAPTAEPADEAERLVVVDNNTEHSIVLENARDVFAGGTIIRVEPVTQGEIYDRVETALADMATMDRVTVWEIDALLDEQPVQPSEPVTFTAQIPGHLSADGLKMFYVPDAGEREEIPIKVDEADNTFTATLTHFSTYVLVNGSAPAQNSAPAQATAPVVEDASAGTPPVILCLLLALAAAALVAGAVLVVKKRRS